MALQIQAWTAGGTLIAEANLGQGATAVAAFPTSVIDAAYIVRNAPGTPTVHRVDVFGSNLIISTSGYPAATGSSGYVSHLVAVPGGYYAVLHQVAASDTYQIEVYSSGTLQAHWSVGDQPGALCWNAHLSQLLFGLFYRQFNSPNTSGYYEFAIDGTAGLAMNPLPSNLCVRLAVDSLGQRFYGTDGSTLPPMLINGFDAHDWIPMVLSWDDAGDVLWQWPPIPEQYPWELEFPDTFTDPHPPVDERPVVALRVSPITGNLAVLASGNTNRLYVFSPTGALLTDWSVGTYGGPARDLAIDPNSGDLFIASPNQGVHGGDAYQIQRFQEDGTPVQAWDTGLDDITALAFTAQSHQLLVVHRNPGTAVNQVQPPGFLPGPGSYPVGTSVSMSCATEGATIHYTIDDPVLTSGSSIYSTPLPFGEEGTHTLRAFATKAGMLDSYVTTGLYNFYKPPDPRGWNPVDRQLTALLAPDGRLHVIIPFYNQLWAFRADSADASFSLAWRYISEDSRPGLIQEDTGRLHVVTQDRNRNVHDLHHAYSTDDGESWEE